MARQAAIDAGARDAWLVDEDGKITEAASANAWIVTPGGALVTRHADHAILRGITRTVALDVVKAQGLSVEERAFTLAEAYGAREAFETSATQIVMPVVSIDGHKIGDGKPVPVALALRREFHRFAESGQAAGFRPPLACSQLGLATFPAAPSNGWSLGRFGRVWRRGRGEK